MAVSFADGPDEGRQSVSGLSTLLRPRSAVCPGRDARCPGRWHHPPSPDTSTRERAVSSAPTHAPTTAGIDRYTSDTGMLPLTSLRRHLPGADAGPTPSSVSPTGHAPGCLQRAGVLERVRTCRRHSWGRRLEHEDCARPAPVIAGPLPGGMTAGRGPAPRGLGLRGGACALCGREGEPVGAVRHVVCVRRGLHRGEGAAERGDCHRDEGFACRRCPHRRDAQRARHRG